MLTRRTSHITTMGANWSRRAPLTARVETCQFTFNLLQDTRRFALVVDPSQKSFEKDHLDGSIVWGGVQTSQQMVDAAFRHLGSCIDFTLVICTHSACDDPTAYTSLLSGFAPWLHELPRDGGTGILTEAILVQGGTEAFQQLFPFACSSSASEHDRLYPSCIRLSHPRVYLSHWGVASDPAVVVDALHCTHVVNCTPHHPNMCEDQGVQYLRVPVVDDADQDIQSYLKEAVMFIDAAAAQNGTVLVHCKHGQSRSASVVAAWLCTSAEKGWSVADALADLKKCRPRVCPNQGFQQQLAAFVEAETGLSH